MNAKPAVSPKLQRVLLQLHLLVGGILGAPLIVLGLTGSILVFDDEISGMINPEAPKATVGTAQPVSKIIDAAQTAAPGLAANFLFLPEPGTDDPASVNFAARGQAPGPGGVRILVDPVTLAVLGQAGRADNWLRIVHQLHSSMLLELRPGRVVVGWLGIAMCILGLSGIVLWWHKVRAQHGLRAKLSLRTGTRGVVFLREIHAFAGIWSLLVFMAVSFTGVYLAMPQQVTALVRVFAPEARDFRGIVDAKVTPTAAAALDVDGVLRLAEINLPGTHVRALRLPARPDQGYRLSLARGGYERGQPMINASVDQWQGTVSQVTDPASLGAAETFMAWQHAVHAGEGLGLAWKILVFISGLLPALFAITGIAMWWMKRRLRRRAMDATERGPQEWA